MKPQFGLVLIWMFVKHTEFCIHSAAVLCDIDEVFTSMLENYRKALSRFIRKFWQQNKKFRKKALKWKFIFNPPYWFITSFPWPEASFVNSQRFWYLPACESFLGMDLSGNSWNKILSVLQRLACRSEFVFLFKQKRARHSSKVPKKSYANEYLQKRL